VEDLPALGIESGKAKNFISELRASDQLSVDAFLEYRTEFLDVGKAAIALYLIARENPNALFAEQRDWYTALLTRMSENAPFERFGENNVGFITFNYDRSLEQYLFTVLAARYGKKPGEVGEVLRKIPFIHVHGQLGYLPWQKCGAGEQREYDTERSKTTIDIGAKGIKVISENIDDSPDFLRARELMGNAKQIFLLGFGYHPKNMERLKIPFADGRAVHGTCYGLTEAEKEKIRSANRPGLDYIPGLQLGRQNHAIAEYLRNETVFLRD
jgi:hypothetical protein